ncbi:MAG: copper-containing nitrite reductase [Anaerolineales bacterium]
MAFPDFNAESDHVVGPGSKTTLTFLVTKGGSFSYHCSLPGHNEAGMHGMFNASGADLAQAPTSPVVSGNAVAASGPVVVNGEATSGADIVRDPTEIPAPIGNRGPEVVRIDLEAVEIEGQLADGTTYKYWTFNGKVPGPFFRVRVGDTIEVHLKNLTNSTMPHSVDFHAVTGPGGGAVMTSTAPGQETMFTAKALQPGLYVYHCATPMVAQHIANGMYGLILVEPEGGLPPVDREFYVMQGEIYTKEAFGSTGLLTEDTQALLNENPEYLVFNGAVGGLTEQKPLKANVGETIRIFFGVGGPNFTSSFHMIGEIFDRVYDQASLTSAPLTNVQTTIVPPGGATMVELGLEVPGRYILVDHALARLQRGLAGFLIVDGPAAPEIFDGTPMPGSGH